MLYRDRATVCVSSQAGCAMGCGFCATGQAGFDRHLTTGEIVEQVVVAARRARASRAPAEQRRVHGHGRAAGERGVGVGGDATDPRRPRPVGPAHHAVDGRGRARHPRARRPPLPVTLAVSIHAANDELRDDLVPINRRYPLDAVVERVPGLPRRHGPAGELRVGDDRRGQRSTGRRRRARRPRPPAAPGGARQPDPAQPDAGLADDRLTGRTGAPVPRPARRRWASRATVRRNRGTDIDAACGQLAARHRDRASRLAMAVQQPAERTYEYGLTAAPPPGWTSKCRCGVPRALPVSPT